MSEVSLESSNLRCKTCGESATLSVLADPFGKSDAMNHFCPRHAPAIGWGGVENLAQQRNDALADAEQLRSLLAELRRDWIQLSKSGDGCSLGKQVLAAITRKGHETSPQAPSARILVDESGECHSVAMYAPGLPPGEHDVYLDPSAPGIPGNAVKASVDVDAKLKELRERMMATDSTEKESAPQCEAIEQLFPALDGPKYRCRLPGQRQRAESEKP